MLLACNRSYLKSVLRYTLLVLDAYHEGTRREQQCDHPCLLFEVKKGSASEQKFGKLWSKRLKDAYGRAIDAGLSNWKPVFDPR